MLSSNFFFVKQKTAYEMRISDWSSDVCSSDLLHLGLEVVGDLPHGDVEEATGLAGAGHADHQVRERVRVPGERRGEALARLHVLTHDPEHPAELGVLGLLGHDRESAQHCQACIDHGGELT